jgi:hypothetical protein
MHDTWCVTLGAESGCMHGKGWPRLITDGMGWGNSGTTPKTEGVDSLLYTSEAAKQLGLKGVKVPLPPSVFGVVPEFPHPIPSVFSTFAWKQTLPSKGGPGR